MSLPSLASAAALCLAFCLHLSSAHSRPITAASGLRLLRTSHLFPLEASCDVRGDSDSGQPFMIPPRIRLHAVFTVTPEYSQWRLSQ